MTIFMDNSGDLLVVDGLREVMLRVSGREDTYIPAALDEPTSFREIEASNGQLRRGDRKFIWQYKLNQRPPLGSQIIDDFGVVWTILTLQYKDQVETWEANCRALAVEAGLDNAATVLRADTYTKNASGEAIPVWTVLATGIPARWQPLSEDAEIFEDADFTRTTYRVTFGDDPIDNPKELAGGDYRIVDADGNRYRVLQYQREERIDTLPVAIAVKILEGAEYYDYGGQSGA